MIDFFTVFVAAVASFVAVSEANLVSKANLSNKQSSATLIYQNNLNASDDKNHIGALILDPVPQADAAAACAMLNERLLSQATIQKHEADFQDAISYQDFARYTDAGRGYYIDNGIVSVGTRVTFSSVTGQRKVLPILCTQSANNGSTNAGPSNGSTVAVTAGGNMYIGYRNQKSFRFLGIPYADRPQRFKYSTPYSKTNQTIETFAYGSQCAQGGSGSEDCLFLNIQTPYIPKAGSKSHLRPVLFWIHGGGFTGGSGADSLSDGGNLASKEDIIVVSINYRLSTLGFLAIPGTDIKGNFGIADQITALDWVVANIAAFGGDPKKISIAGESAGAGSIRTLLGSPQAIGKYQGAIAMSNLGGGVTLGLSGDYGTTYSTYYTVNQSFNIAGSQIFAAAGCIANQTDVSSQIACLKQVPASKIVGFPTVARYVVQDGKYVNTSNLILSTHSNSTAHVPVIFGITRNDGASFSTYPKTPISNHSQGLQVALGINATWAERIIQSNLFPLTSTGNLTLDSFNVSQRIATDKTFRCVDQATVYAGVSTRAFQKAYYYQFERTIDGYDPNNLGQPANDDPKNPYFRFHGADMPWVFGTLNRIREPEDLWSSQLVSSYFGAFVRTGDPNPSLQYLDARGYVKVVEGVKKYGNWGEVNASKKNGNEMRLLDWPSRNAAFSDIEQCAWLGYPLNYYLKGGQ